LAAQRHARIFQRNGIASSTRPCSSHRGWRGSSIGITAAATARQHQKSAASSRRGALAAKTAASARGAGIGVGIAYRHGGIGAVARHASLSRMARRHIMALRRAIHKTYRLQQASAARFHRVKSANASK